MTIYILQHSYRVPSQPGNLGKPGKLLPLFLVGESKFEKSPSYQGKIREFCLSSSRQLAILAASPTGQKGLSRHMHSANRSKWWSWSCLTSIREKSGKNQGILFPMKCWEPCLMFCVYLCMQWNHEKCFIKNHRSILLSSLAHTQGYIEWSE